MSDVLPPPPPRRGGDGCWKWGAVSCAVGCGLLTILIIVLVIAAGPALKKLMGEGVRLAQQSERLSREMHSVWNGLERYHADKGKYPDKLDALVPKYVATPLALKFSQNPAGPEFAYRKPTADLQPTDWVLSYSLTFNAPDGTTVPMDVRILKNGEVQGMNSQRRGRYRPQPE